MGGFGSVSHLNTWVGGWYDPRGFTVDKGETQSFVTKGQYKQLYCHRDASHYSKHKHNNFTRDWEGSGSFQSVPDLATTLFAWRIEK